MSTGYATMADGLTAAQVLEQQDRAWDKGREQQAAHERGRALLGFQFVRLPGINSGMAWVKRNAEQLDGLPATLQAKARDAMATTWAALRALEAADKEASAWIAKNKPSDGLAVLKREEFTLAARNAYADANAALENVCSEVGGVAGRVEEARATLAGIERRRKQADAEHRASVEQINADEGNARRVLQALGL